MIKKFRIRRTTLITAGLLAFLAGLGMSRLGSLSGAWVWVALIICPATLKRLRPITLLAVIIFGLSFGWWRGTDFLNRLEPYKTIEKGTVILEVTAVTDANYTDKSQLGFDAGSIHMMEPYEAEMPGKIKVEGFGEQAIYRGDVVRIEGKFFPTRGSRRGTVSYASLNVLGRSDSFIDELRLKFAAGMQTALPEPLASFALGLLIGQRTTLPDEISKQLSIVGLTHIIAVSGYNLTIIVRAVRRFGRKWSKYQITVLSSALIISFLLVTGFSASIVRAAIVSGLSLLAWYYGRNFRPILLLAVAAALTAGWNPLYIWSDIGWYLSFLAFYGVIVLVPTIVKRFYAARSPRPLTFLLLETTGAQLMTMPLILYIFSEASSVAILSNLLIVPLVPIAMLLSLLAGLAGMIFSVLAGWIAWPAKLLLTYILDIVNLMSRIPHAAIQRNLSLASMIFLYACVVFVSFVVWRKHPKNAKITDEETMEY